MEYALNFSNTLSLQLPPIEEPQLAAMRSG